MVSESSVFPESSLPTPQNHDESFLGRLVTLISNYNLRYEGIICHLNLQNSTVGLRNVICYGTEDRNQNGFQIPPFNQVHSYILFNGTYIKEIEFTRTNTKPRHHATKPPLPLTCSSYNQPGASNIPLVSNEKLIKPQDSESCSVNGSVNDGVGIASIPQLPGYDSRSSQSLPNGQVPVLPKSFASELMFSATNPPRSFFTTFPPPPVSLQNISGGGFDFQVMRKKLKQPKLCGPLENNNQREEENAKPAYSIDGSCYMISRKPFEDIGRPYNPLGPIARPLKHTEQEKNFKRRPQLQPPPSSRI